MIFIKQEEPLNSYKFQLTLTIKHLQPEDFGTYRCISKNSIGQADEMVELYGESVDSALNILISFEKVIGFYLMFLMSIGNSIQSLAD